MPQSGLSNQQLADHYTNCIKLSAENVCLVIPRSTESGNIGNGPVCQSVCQFVLVHSSMIAAWIFFTLGTMVRYHGLLMHVK